MSEPITTQDAQDLLKSTEDLIKVLNNHQVTPTTQTMGNFTANINAGGIGVLIVTGCASLMLGLCLSLGIIVIHQQKQIDDLHDYLNVVYQYAPQLKPKDFK